MRRRRVQQGQFILLRAPSSRSLPSKHVFCPQDLPSLTSVPNAGVWAFVNFCRQPGFVDKIKTAHPLPGEPRGEWVDAVTSELCGKWSNRIGIDVCNRERRLDRSGTWKRNCNACFVAFVPWLRKHGDFEVGVDREHRLGSRFGFRIRGGRSGEHGQIFHESGELREGRSFCPTTH